MPLFDINAMQGIADGLKGQLERRQLSKVTGDAKRKLNHSMQEADRLVNKQASQQERAARIDASNQETALRVGTIAKGASINARAAKAATALNNQQRSVQTAANVAHSQTTRAVQNKAAIGQHQLSQARAVADYGTQKQLTNVQRQHQIMSQWNSRNQGKALAESGIQHSVERTQSANEAAVERWQEHDELKQAEISHSMKAGSESMGRQLGAFAMKAFNSYTGSQQRAAQQAYSVGRAQMSQAMAGMNTEQRQQYIQSGQWKQHFADYQNKVEAIKHPFVRREAQANLDAKMTAVQASTTADNIKMQSKQNAVDMEDAASEAATTIARHGSGATVGAQKILTDKLNEINDRMPEDSRMSKDDIAKFASQTTSKAVLDSHVARGEVESVEAALADPNISQYLSADEINKTHKWARNEKERVSDEAWEERSRARTTKRWAEADAKERAEIEAGFDQKATTHINTVKTDGQFNDIDNPNAVAGMLEDDQNRMTQIGGVLRESAATGKPITEQQFESLKKQAPAGASPAERNRVYEYNRGVEQLVNKFNTSLTGKDSDIEKVRREMQGEDVRTKMSPQLRYTDNRGRINTKEDAAALGASVVNASTENQMQGVEEMTNQKYGTLASDAIDEGLEEWIKSGRNKTVRKERAQVAELARMNMDARTRDLVDEQKLQKAKKTNHGRKMPADFKKVVPTNTDDIRGKLPSRQIDAITEAYREIATAEATRGMDEQQMEEDKKKVVKDIRNRMNASVTSAQDRLEKAQVGGWDRLTHLSKAVSPDGAIPRIPHADIDPAIGGVGLVRASESLRNLTTAMKPKNFMSVYEGHLSEGTKELLGGLQKAGEPHDIGVRESENEPNRWNLVIRTAQGEQPVMLMDNTQAGGLRKDMLGRGAPVPDLREQGVTVPNYGQEARERAAEIQRRVREERAKGLEAAAKGTRDALTHAPNVGVKAVATALQLLDEEVK